MSSNVERIPTNDEKLFAFRIAGDASADAIRSMAAQVLEGIEHFGSINMLLKFDSFEGVELAAGFDIEVLRAQLASVRCVGKYAVIGAPDLARSAIELFDGLLPVEAQTFDQANEERAWRFVGASRHG